VVQFLLYSVGLDDTYSLQCTSSLNDHVSVYTIWPYARGAERSDHIVFKLELELEAGDRGHLRRRDLRFSKAVWSYLGLPHYMPPPASRSAILRLLNANRQTACPCHGCTTATGSLQAIMNLRKYAAPVEASNKEYAFEVCTLCKAQAHALTVSSGLGCEFALR
jgi:hypothetical protein